MKIFKTTEGIMVKSDEGYFLSSENNWDTFMNRDDLFKHLTASLNNAADFTSLSVFDERNILAPIGSHFINQALKNTQLLPAGLPSMFPV